jgi:hypothetical protein
MPDATYEIRIPGNATSSTGTTIRSLSAVDIIGESSPMASRTIAPVTSPGQAYYWSHIWQLGERETRAQLAAVRFRTFDDAQAAVAYLLAAD